MVQVNKKKVSCRGAALIEALIVLGMLIFFLMALFDLFFMSGLYVNLSQFAREGVLQGGGMSYFYNSSATPSCYPSTVTQTDLQDGDLRYENCKYTEGDSTCGHYIVQWRIEKLFETLSASTVDPSTSTVTTTCIPGSPPTLQVELQVRYRGYSPVFRNSMLRVRQIGLVRG